MRAHRVDVSKLSAENIAVLVAVKVYKVVLWSEYSIDDAQLMNQKTDTE